MTEAQSFEKGLLLVALGRVQKSRGRIPSAKKHLNDAIKCFKGVNSTQAKEHERHAKESLAQLSSPPPATAKPVHQGILRRLLNWIKNRL